VVEYYTNNLGFMSRPLLYTRCKDKGNKVLQSRASGNNSVVKYYTNNPEVNFKSSHCFTLCKYDRENEVLYSRASSSSSVVEHYTSNVGVKGSKPARLMKKLYSPGPGSDWFIKDLILVFHLLNSGKNLSSLMTSRAYTIKLFTLIN
jgi:hypothetical protein